MPVKVQIDQDARNSSAANTSGLLLGTDEPQFRILHLVPTPTRPSGVSSHRWAVEHANLVQPMCPGGLSILGSYLPLRGTSATHSNQLDSAAAIARDVTAVHRNGQTSILICRAAKGRVIAKLVSPNSSDSLKNADLKEIPHLSSSLVSIRATLPITNATFPSVSASQSPRNFRSACHKLTQNLASSFILQLPDKQSTIVTDIEDTRALADVMEWDTNSSDSNFSLRIHLLTPVCPTLDKSNTDAEPSSSLPAAFTRLQGNLHLEAVTAIDASIGQVLGALQVDLTRSIHTRVDLLVESYLRSNDEETDDKLDLPENSVFPARVVATHNSSGLGFLSLSEYLMPGEAMDEDVTSRFAEAFSWGEELIASCKLDMKEDYNQEPPEDDIKPRTISHATEIPSPHGLSGNEIDIQNVMQTSLLVAAVLGFAAILIKQLLYFW